MQEQARNWEKVAETRKHADRPGCSVAEINRRLDAYLIDIQADTQYTSTHTSDDTDYSKHAAHKTRQIQHAKQDWVLLLKTDVDAFNAKVQTWPRPLDLSGADLSWANLCDADLSEVTLNGASFQHASYNGATRIPEIDPKKYNMLYEPRRIMVVDDSKNDITFLTRALNQARENDFKEWGELDQKTKQILHSMELSPYVNQLDTNKSSPDEMFPLGSILKELVTASSKDTPYSGVISDLSMHNSHQINEDSYKPDPKNPDQTFYNNPNAVGGKEADYKGGLEMAKIANMMGVPLVIYSGETETATKMIASKHLRHLKPAKAEVFGKDQYKEIFTGLAKNILAHEQEQATGRACS